MKTLVLSVLLAIATTAFAGPPLRTAVRYVDQTMGSDGVCCDDEHDWPGCTEPEYCCDEASCEYCGCYPPPANDGLTPATAKYSLQAALASVPADEIPEVNIIGSCVVGDDIIELPPGGATFRGIDGGSLFTANFNERMATWMAAAPSSTLILEDLFFGGSLEGGGGETIIRNTTINSDWGSGISGDVTIESSLISWGFYWTPVLANGDRKGRLVVRDSGFFSDYGQSSLNVSTAGSPDGDSSHVVVRIERSSFGTYPGCCVNNAVAAALGEDSMTLLLFDNTFYPTAYGPGLRIYGDVKLGGTQRVDGP